MWSSVMGVMPWYLGNHTRYRSKMRVCELQKRQRAKPVDMGISSQIVICLLFACDYLRYTVLHQCITQRAGEYRINCISLLILSILLILIYVSPCIWRGKCKARPILLFLGCFYNSIEIKWQEKAKNRPWQRVAQADIFCPSDICPDFFFVHGEKLFVHLWHIVATFGNFLANCDNTWHHMASFGNLCPVRIHVAYSRLIWVEKVLHTD